MRKSAERKIVQDVTRDTLLPCLDHDTKLTSTAETDNHKTYLLPDRIIITVSVVRFRCVDILLQPSFTGKKQRIPRHFSPQHHEMTLTFARLYGQCRVVRWHDDFPRTVEHMTKEPSTRYGLEDSPCLLSAHSSQFRLFLVSLAKFIRVASEFVVQRLHPDTVFQICILTALASTSLP